MDRTVLIGKEINHKTHGKGIIVNFRSIPHYEVVDVMFENGQKSIELYDGLLSDEVVEKDAELKELFDKVFFTEKESDGIKDMPSKGSNTRKEEHNKHREKKLMINMINEVLAEDKTPGWKGTKYALSYICHQSGFYLHKTCLLRG